MPQFVANKHIQRKYLLSLALLIAWNVTAFSQQKRMLLWFDKPAYQPKVFTYDVPVFKKPFTFEATGWYEALPVGNSRLGAMVFGGVLKERVQLNEKSLWAGYQFDAVNPQSGKALPEVQRLMFEGKIDSSEQLAERTMLGIPTRISPYQSLGDLFIEHIAKPDDTVYTNYRRWLSLDSAVATTVYTYKGIRYRIEVFASHPANVIIIKLSCDKPRGLNLNISMLREQDAVVSASSGDPNSIYMNGRIKHHDKQGNPVGMRFASYVKGITSTGKISVSQAGVMTVKDAGELILFISAGTSYGGKNAEETARRILNQAIEKPVVSLFKAHLKDYQSLYSRVKLNIVSKENPMLLPLDKRLARVKENDYEDPYLSELVYQYGRYLLISSSRKGDLPANLQGVWNQTMNPPWSADYHTNSNFQTNYMAAEAANLAECTLPFYALMDSLAKYGQHTAKVMYNARGWVVHHLTDVFWRTAPADALVGVWPMGGGWLAHHPYDHYLFSGDKTFLKNRAYPLMKGAASFYLDFLKPIPAGLPMAGKLVTNPSHSPENAYENEDGKQSMFTYGAAMDMQICTELFINCLQAIKDLSADGKPFDPEFKAELEKALANIAPIQISKKTGAIQEWIEDYKEPEIGHRHISHLYALFPATQITAATPELYAAARKTLERRLAGNPNAAIEEANNRFKSYHSYLGGKSFGGYQSTWIGLMYLRLGNTEEPYKHHQYLLKYGFSSNLWGRAYQLDATLGAPALITEMLLQSHTGTLNLLPAVPKAWPNGSISGLRARGGFEVDLKWKDTNLTEAQIKSKNGGVCKLSTKNGVMIFNKGIELKPAKNADNRLEFNTQKGEVYKVVGL
jgi:alpha-L-fucosidase 2